MGRFLLQSSDGEEFEVEGDILKHSALLSPFTDHEDEETSSAGAAAEAAMPIPIPSVKGTTLRKVLDWCTFHRNDLLPTPEDETRYSERPMNPDNISPFDAEFLNRLDNDQLFEVILAANYLNIKKLLDLTCQDVANKVKGKSPNEIRKFFNIHPAVNDEAQAMDENTQAVDEKTQAMD